MNIYNIYVYLYEQKFGLANVIVHIDDIAQAQVIVGMKLDADITLNSKLIIYVHVNRQNNEGILRVKWGLLH